MLLWVINIVTLQIVKVKNVFQVKDISASYRIRGNVARTHRKVKANVIIFTICVRLILLNLPFNINVAVKTVTNRILPYSAIKSKANSPLPYSILKPDTSSDSPSAKSNGDRLVSASIVIIHAEKIKGKINIIHKVGIWLIDVFSMLKLREISRILIINSAILIS